MKRFLPCALLAAFFILPACGSIADDPSDTAAETIRAEENTADAVPTAPFPTTTMPYDLPPAPVPSQDTVAFGIGFQINTHGYVEGEGAQREALLYSRQALAVFYESDPDSNKHLYQPSLTKYDDAFFRDKALLLLVKQEPSDSNTLEVHDVILESGRMEARVARVAQEAGTMDMARWVIAVELNKNALPEGDIPFSAVYY